MWAELNYGYEGVKKIGTTCAKAADRRGVSRCALDELQFLSQSATANTAVTKFLYQITYLGLPFVFVANYSLCRLLQRRPEQDRQRLLTKPRILLALLPESQDWEDYLVAIQTTLASSLHIDLLRERETLHHFTAGMKRLVKQLLVLAYDLAWQKGQRFVTPADLRCAYDNTEYAMAREQAQAMLSPHTHRHKAYECPFPLPKVGAEALADRHRQALLQDTSRAIQIDALSKAQRQALPKPAPPKPPTSRPRRKVTPEELLETTNRRSRQV